MCNSLFKVSHLYRQRNQRTRDKVIVIWAQKHKAYKLCPHNPRMYHEIRKIKGKTQNYLISNRRGSHGWIKKSRVIGYGEISKDKISYLKKKFEIELVSSKK